MCGRGGGSPLTGRAAWSKDCAHGPALPGWAKRDTLNFKTRCFPSTDDPTSFVLVALSGLLGRAGVPADGRPRSRPLLCGSVERARRQHHGCEAGRGSLCRCGRGRGVPVRGCSQRGSPSEWDLSSIPVPAGVDADEPHTNPKHSASQVPMRGRWSHVISRP